MPRANPSLLTTRDCRWSLVFSQPPTHKATPTPLRCGTREHPFNHPPILAGCILKATTYNLSIGLTDDPHNFGHAWFPCFDNFRRALHLRVVVPDHLAISHVRNRRFRGRNTPAQTTTKKYGALITLMCLPARTM